MQVINHSENTTKIMYIGPKAVKRDLITGFKPTLRFIRNEPENVPYSVAQALLDFDCFVLATEGAIEEANAKARIDAEKAEEQAKKEAAEKLKELDKGDTVLEVEGESVDIGKYTSGQLATFVEAHNLEVEKGAQEKVADFALRVRDAYREAQVGE